MNPEPSCYGFTLHNYQHVVKTITASGTGETADIVYIYCTQCGDIIQIGESEEDDGPNL